MVEKAHKHFTYIELSDFILRTLTSINTPLHIANIVTSSIINAEATGHITHGINGLIDLIRQAINKEIIPASEPFIEEEIFTNSFIIDAQKGLGAYAMDWAIDLLIKKTQSDSMPLAVCWVNNTNNIGSLSTYMEKLTSNSLLGFCVRGSINVDSESVVFPPNSTKRMLGTNPIAFGMPTSNFNRPYIMDMATSETTYHYVNLCNKLNKKLSDVKITTSSGRKSNSPQDFFNDGGIGLMGGHKGFALSILGAILSSLGSIKKEQDFLKGIFVLAFNLKSLKNNESILNTLTNVFSTLKDKDQDNIRLPFEHSIKCREESKKYGFNVPLVLLNEIDGLLQNRVGRNTIV